MFKPLSIIIITTQDDNSLLGPRHSYIVEASIFDTVQWEIFSKNQDLIPLKPLSGMNRHSFILILIL